MNCYFYFVLLDLRSSECNVVSLYVVCCSVNVSVCFSTYHDLHHGGIC